MHLSTRGRYAVRAMLDVALHSDDQPVSREEIASRQAISPDYIAQLFPKLERAGLVRGLKGPGGGYVLGRDPAQIPVGEIVRAVEGPIALVDCVGPEGAARCARAGSCITRTLWESASRAVAETLNGVTLADLCSQANRSDNEPAL